MLLECGRLKLPAHFHAGRPEPSFGRSRDSDVRNLDEVITDVRFFGTKFVLIHAGMPQVEEAAYLGSKPHVWVDVSALPFIYPVPENAAFLRMLLIACPDKVLFGTDALNGSWVPVGPEVMHVALCRLEREALYLALAGLVRDGLLDMDQAVKMGEMVLHRNAEKLYGFSEQTMNVGK
jgi:predicted TIM-barrel fold metal-dependent hydrolase